ncbi:MAG: hypothetical protein KC736_04530 [Candidatus Moranbacteria bacterium]|nr:hypothetical protein [Candidatus Moranbacteria bacterium]
MKRLLCLLFFLMLASSVSFAATHSGYESAKRSESGDCPNVGQVPDRWNFITCNCTSYVAYKINSILDSHSPTDPMFHNHFTMNESFRWGDAENWIEAFGEAVGGYIGKYPLVSRNNPSHPWVRVGPDISM